MLDERSFELLNAEIDGALSSADRAELSRRLLESTELRALREELRAACADLERLPLVEPPAGLREKILAALPTTSVADPPARGGFSMTPRTYRYAAAIVGGLLVGTLAFEASRSLIGPDQVVGTMAGEQATDALLQGGMRVEAGGVRGTITLTPVPQGLEVRFTRDVGRPGATLAPADIEVFVERGAAVTRLEPVAAAQQNPVAAYGAVLPGVLSPGETVQVRVQASGVPVFEGRWQAPGVR